MKDFQNKKLIYKCFRIFLIILILNICLQAFILTKIFLSSLILFIFYLLYFITQKHNFPTYKNKDYFQEYEDKNKYKKFYIIKKYIQNFKSHIYSHILMLFGWFCGLLFLLYFLEKQGDKSLYLLVSITISCYLFFIILVYLLLEIIFFQKFKIKWKFIYENSFYNIIWLLGQFSTLLFIFKIIIPLFILNQSVF